MVEKAYQKYAWILLFVLGLSGLAFGAMLMTTGMEAASNVVEDLEGRTWADVEATSGEAALLDHVASSWGVTAMFLSLFVVVLSAGPFRAGERWAWYALWIFPAYLAVTVTFSAATGVMSVVTFDAPSVALFVVGMLLPYRKFFPKA